MAIGTPTLIGSTASTGTGTTVVATLTGAVSTGNQVILGTICDTISTTVTVADSRGNTYNVDQTFNTNARTSYVASAKITTALQVNDTITVTYSGTVGSRRIACYSVSGLDQTTWLDQHTTGNGNSASPSAGPVTTTTANELLFGCSGYVNGGATYTQGTGYTKLDELSQGT